MKYVLQFMSCVTKKITCIFIYQMYHENIILAMQNINLYIMLRNEIDMMHNNIMYQQTRMK